MTLHPGARGQKVFLAAEFAVAVRSLQLISVLRGEGQIRETFRKATAL